MAARHIFSPTPAHTPDVSIRWDEVRVVASPEAAPSPDRSSPEKRRCAAPAQPTVSLRPQLSQQSQPQQAWRAPRAAVQWANDVTGGGAWLVRARRDAIRRGAGSFGFLPHRLGRGPSTAGVQDRGGSPAAPGRAEPSAPRPPRGAASPAPPAARGPSGTGRPGRAVPPGQPFAWHDYVQRPQRADGIFGGSAATNREYAAG